MAYLAGQEITTVGGQAGTLTGYRDLHGNPYVQFDSGPLYAVRRDGIEGPLSTSSAVPGRHTTIRRPATPYATVTSCSCPRTASLRSFTARGR